MRPFTLFKFLGLTTAITPVGVGAFLLATAALAWLASAEGGLGFGAGWAAGPVSAAAMFASEWLHQAGHGLAARLTGHPMTGMTFFSVLARSEYPPDEPPLPASVHIRRALGGFWVNLALGVGLLSVLQSDVFLGEALTWATGFSAFYNLAVLGLGALIPIDIPNVLTTDGGTLWRYWRRRA